jgi:hypothetical protein
LGGAIKVDVPAFSIQVIEMPMAGHEPVAASSMTDALAPRLILLAPQEAPADLPLELVVALVNDSVTRGHPADPGPVSLSVAGAATARRETGELRQSVGRFLLDADAPGPVTVTVKAGPLEVSADILFLAVESREWITWTFDNPIAEWAVESTFSVGMNPAIRPNEYVASVGLEEDLPAPQKDVLLSFTRLPEGLDPAKVGGLVGEIQASRDFQCEDQSAFVQVVLQSEADHWMVIDSIPLESIRGEWKKLRIELEDPRILEAMKRLYAVRFVVQSSGPVTGELYFDNLGFLLRAFPKE